MIEPTLNYVPCPDSGAGHRMAYWQWGNPLASHVVVCVHGLGRQGRDFDVLARELCRRGGETLRVVCPDVVGRGKSDWLQDPMAYQVPQYASDMLALLAHIQPGILDWVGTSMGALIGLVMCGQPGLPMPVKVRKLVLNDFGPVVQWVFIERLKSYFGNMGRYTSVQQAADAMWAISTTFGPHTPEQWLALCTPMVKPIEGEPGMFTLHYDPAIAVPVRAVTQEQAEQGEAMQWQLYDNIRADTLLLRGARSDLLSTETALEMTQRGPKARLVEIAGVGHAPTLIADDQVQTVASFLLE